jgi:hypothetical protein
MVGKEDEREQFHSIVHAWRHALEGKKRDYAGI